MRLDAVVESRDRPAHSRGQTIPNSRPKPMLQLPDEKLVRGIDRRRLVAA
jgi:hypothetical protein